MKVIGIIGVLMFAAVPVSLMALSLTDTSYSDTVSIDANYYIAESYYTNKLCVICDKSISVWHNGWGNNLLFTTDGGVATLTRTSGSCELGGEDVCKECDEKYSESYHSLVATWWKLRRSENADLITKHSSERAAARIDEINAKIARLREELVEAESE